MKIHYISHHAILEYDEVQMFLDMGHEVFSNGAYLDPKGHVTLPRPGLKGGKYYEDYVKLATENPPTNLPEELIEPFDVIIVMHNPNVIIQNWDKIKHKKVIWRSIGQSIPQIERKLAPLREEGLIVVRYSPKEANLEDYMGADAMIRFYKDEDVYKGWTGETKDVVNFSQSLKGRREFCHYDQIMPVIKQFKGMVYGPGNEDLAGYNGGQIPFDKMLDVMRQSRVMLYGGTWPAAYTLSFIEALMMGLPIVAVSKAIAHVPQFQHIDFYEVDEILVSISGVVCDTSEQMIEHTKQLLNDPELAADISKRQREKALELFSKKVISAEWKELLDGIA